MRVLLAATFVASIFMAGDSYALDLGGNADADATAVGVGLGIGVGKSNSESEANATAILNTRFKNFLSQQQQQAQVQGNTQETNIDFESQKQPASVAVSAPSFGAAVSDGVINACAGSEAWSVSLGGSFFTPTGNPVSAGLGGGNQTLVTLNLCEVRAVAWQIATRMEGEVAEKVYHAVMCQHPTYRAGTISIGGTCPTIPEYSMEVALGGMADRRVSSAPPDRDPRVQTASLTRGTGSQHPDFKNLQ